MNYKPGKSTQGLFPSWQESQYFHGILTPQFSPTSMHPAITALSPEATKPLPRWLLQAVGPPARQARWLPCCPPPSRARQLGGLTRPGGHEILDLDFVFIPAQILFFPKTQPS